MNLKDNPPRPKLIIKSDRRYIFLAVVPLIFVGIVHLYSYLFYQNYYGTSAPIPFNIYALWVKAGLGSSLLVTMYIMTTFERKKLIKENLDLQSQPDQVVARLQQEITSLKEYEKRLKQLLAKFLATQKPEVLIDYVYSVENSDQRSEIIEAKLLTGGYSGAQVYLCRMKNKLPRVLKVARAEEIENEHEKFVNHVGEGLRIAPRRCWKYCWNDYAGLEYDLNWNRVSDDHLTFLDLYKESLKSNPGQVVTIDTIEKKVIKKLLQEELQAKDQWWENNRIEDISVNIYEEHYPFTRNFDKIHPYLNEDVWRRANSVLSQDPLKKYQHALNNLVSKRKWNDRRSRDHRFSIVRATIHGDLNSRNILLEAEPENHNIINAIGLVDFSHTGNGLKKKDTDDYIGQGIRLDREKGHIANDFCRLEADIKFYLTDLDNEQELRQAWILECLLLEQGLELQSWDKLEESNAFGKMLNQQSLLSSADWQGLAEKNCWTKDNARKFYLAWQSIKAIRDTLRQILERNLPQGGMALLQPFYLSLLQASLSMIYWEDERFHNANLQKLYLTLASGLLAKRLDITEN